VTTTMNMGCICLCGEFAPAGKSCPRLRPHVNSKGKGVKRRIWCEAHARHYNSGQKHADNHVVCADNVCRLRSGEYMYIFYVHLCVFACVYMYVFICIYVYVYICTHVHVYKCNVLVGCLPSLIDPCYHQLRSPHLGLYCVEGAFTPRVCEAGPQQPKPMPGSLITTHHWSCFSFHSDCTK
jgi:hypothetical protein